MERNVRRGARRQYGMFQLRENTIVFKSVFVFVFESVIVFVSVFVTVFVSVSVLVSVSIFRLIGAVAHQSGVPDWDANVFIIGWCLTLEL